MLENVEAVFDKKGTEIFDNLKQAFFEIKQKEIRHQYFIANYCVELVFLNDKLASFITSAFLHLKNNHAFKKPDLTIYIWDIESTNCNLKPMDWRLIQMKGYYGLRQSEISLQYFQCIEALSVINLNINEGLYILKSSDLPWWVSGSPLQVLLNWWFASRGLQLTHAAAIAKGNSAIILAGRGGSGKSTTTLSCLEQGWNYLSEDYCLLGNVEHPKVYSVYNSTKLEPNTLKQFPAYKKFIKNPERDTSSEKALLFYQDIFTSQMSIEANVKAIVALTVSNSEKPVIVELDKETALSKLLTSSVIQLPACGKEAHDILKTIVKAIPCYSLQLSTDFKKNVKILENLLD